MVEAEEDLTGTLMVRAIAFVRLIDRLGILSYCQNGWKWVDMYVHTEEIFLAFHFRLSHQRQSWLQTWFARRQGKGGCQ